MSQTLGYFLSYQTDTINRYSSKRELDYWYGIDNYSCCLWCLPITRAFIYFRNQWKEDLTKSMLGRIWEVLQSWYLVGTLAMMFNVLKSIYNLLQIDSVMEQTYITY